MRNLKRALSLALASVMLLGMMVVGTSAASADDFTDADKIVNKEAVAIATGLGIFDGYTDGSFGPDKVVTRAEAAVVIAKILHGSNVNPANLAGAGKFTDVPAWAEGYVNMVAALKIIEGRGEGIFDPNAPVTTAEYSTMLLKALGYYVNGVDVLDADWALTVTSKASSLGLYGDLSLKMHEGLTRENVAALTYNALFAQRVAFNDYRGQYVKTNDRDVVVTNGTDDEMNTLAQNVFGLYIVEGTVVANGYTDESLLDENNKPAYTTVEFDEVADLDKDGRFTDADYDFEYVTDLDMIGHAAKVYYKVEKKAPVVFAITDQATLVGTITADRSGVMAKAANALGFKKDTVMDVINANAAILNYDEDVTVLGTDVMGTYATADKTLVLISNSNNLAVDCVIVLDQKLDKMAEIDASEDEVYYELEEANGYAYDYIIPTFAVEEGDYVVTTKIGGDAGAEGIVVAEPVELVSAEISKLIGRSGTGASTTLTGVVADGDTYAESPVVVEADLSDTTAYQAIEKVGAVTLVLDETGKLIALAEDVIPDIGYAYVAQFGTDRAKTEDGLKYEDVLTALIYFADGTVETREVDLDQTRATNDETAAAIVAQVTGTNTIANDYENLNAGTGIGNGADGTYVGIYYLKENADGSVRLVDIDTLDTGATPNRVAYTDGVVSYAGTLTDLKFTKGHALQMDKNGAVLSFANGYTRTNTRMYANDKTVFFYVDGEYGNDNDPLTVIPVVGIAGAYTFTNNSNIKEYWMTLNETGRNTVKAMLVEDLDLSASTVYFYKQGNFEAYADAEGKGVVEYHVYNLDGTKAANIVYDGFASVANARAHAQAKPNGFYQAGKADLNVTWTTDGDENNGPVNYGTTGTTYAVGAIAEYDELAQNLYAVLDMGNGRDGDDYENIGVIFDDATVIDLTGNGINSVTKLINATKLDRNNDRNEVEIAYSFPNSSFISNAVFVTSYTLKDEAGTNNNQGNDIAFTINSVVNAGGNFQINMTTLKAITADAANKVAIDFEIYKANNSEGDALVCTGTEYIASDRAASSAISLTGSAVAEAGNYYAVVIMGGEVVESVNFRVVPAAY